MFAVEEVISIKTSTSSHCFLPRALVSLQRRANREMDAGQGTFQMVHLSWTTDRRHTSIKRAIDPVFLQMRVRVAGNEQGGR